MEIILVISALACLGVLFAYVPRVAIFVVCAPFLAYALIVIRELIR